MFFRTYSSRVFSSSFIEPTFLVGVLYFSSSQSTKKYLSDDHSTSRNDGRKRSWLNIPYLDSARIPVSSLYCIQSTKCEYDTAAGATIRKRMTSIGHFTLKSQTSQNLSIPTFFIALASNLSSNDSIPVDLLPYKKPSDFTLSELESIWAKKNMAHLHPRFHSKICTKDEGFFIQDASQIDRFRLLQDYARETLHPFSYRVDLQKRIEYLLTQPMETSKHLWEVYISNGPLGSSGAISQKKVAAYERKGADKAAQEYKDVNISMIDEQNKHYIKPRETLLLFRAHHAIADGVSLVAALGDLVDEADKINLHLNDEIRKRQELLRWQRPLQRICRFLINCVRFFIGALLAFFRHLYFMAIAWNHNPFLNATHTSKFTNVDSSDVYQSTRSVSWCEIATVEEVKSIAKTVGPNVTINDVFVSCVTRALAHQLSEHRERIALESHSKASQKEENYINIVIPVHLFGGIHIPGSEMGNRIGAFVARVPCEGKRDVGMTEYSSIKHLESVHASLQAVKNSPSAIISFLIAKVSTTCLPSSWVKFLFRQMSANAAAVITNTRGFPMKVHINGRSVEAVAGFLPLPPGIPVGVVIQSYNDMISISLTAEKWAIPDADRFLGWVLEEYENVLDETRK